MATSVWNFLRRRPWRRWRRNSIRWLESRAVDFVFVRACAHVFRECLCCHQFRTATSTSILTTSVWNFFSPPPSAALAQELRALAKKSCCGFCFRPPEPASWLPPFGFFFRRRPWRRWRRNSARWLEDRPVDCVFVRVRTCARSVFVAINPERPPAQPRDYLRLEHFFATPLGGCPPVD